MSLPMTGDAHWQNNKGNGLTACFFMMSKEKSLLNRA